jgi:hypothetical protein
MLRHRTLLRRLQRQCPNQPDIIEVHWVDYREEEKPRPPKDSPEPSSTPDTEPRQL